MEFSSLLFIFRFLPIFLLIYYLVPDRWKNPVLFAGSIVFYAIGSWQDAILLLLSLCLNYALTLVMDRENGSAVWRRTWMIMLVVCDVGVLCFYKFYVRELPLGISFYTFTILSYVLDVYQGRERAERNYIRTGIYVMMFPKLISGPIASFRETIGAIRSRTPDAEKIEHGVSLLIVGLAYKVIIADRLAALWKDIQTIGFESISTPLAWLGIVGYSAQLFFDFQGYSVMAVGLGEMLGFSLPQNFNHPYRAISVGDYYRRWHRTLGAWFKDYLYIPLGGNRKGKLRTCLNLFIVWAVTGIWHGNTWNFLLWASVLFVLIVLEKLGMRRWLERFPGIGHAYILFFMPLTWLIFAVKDIGQLGIYFSRLFPFFGNGIAVNTMDYLQRCKNYGPFLILALLVSMPFADKLWKKYWNKIWMKMLLFVCFWICVWMLAKGNQNPFLYFVF